MLSKSQFLALVTAATLLTNGCGRSDLGKVTGTVKLDGQPLPNATVIFSPVEPASPSAGRTDSDGQYTLIYTRSAVGAKAGKHNVSISTFQKGNPDADPPIPEAAERLPPAYRQPGALTAEVKPGQNQLDFELSSSGPSSGLAPLAATGRGDVDPNRCD